VHIILEGGQITIEPSRDPGGILHRYARDR
jgi:hypothetical protein